MLYTVKPLECIYATPYRQVQKAMENPKQEGEYRDVLLPHGRIVARREGENFVIERINSTNMGDYLKEDYSPGKQING